MIRSSDVKIVSMVALGIILAKPALAGGPKYVAGATYFNPGVIGQPVVWTGGLVNYYVDQGGLGALSNTQAIAMVDTAASVWNTVSTAAVRLTDAGSLAEDVTGGNVQAGNAVPQVLSFGAPNDVTPTATSTPVAVVFDSDGTVIDALEGAGSSTPTNCSQNGVLVWLDNFNTNATFGHGVIVLNGRCTGTSDLQEMMSYQVERAFGRILGLDFAQIYDGALTSSQPDGALAWPIMDVSEGDCGAAGGLCITNPTTPHWDDLAALSRMYPVTTGNIANFTDKVLTEQNTVSIQGTITFPDGQGMQGVNVVACPLDATGEPMYQYTVTFVSGSDFSGNHGNPVTGWEDAAGDRLDRFGSNIASQEGFFDLSAMPLPPGMKSVNYQVSFGAVNPLYTNSKSVGPYILGSPSPFGTLQTVAVNGLNAGSGQQLTVSAEGILRRPLPLPRPVLPVALAQAQRTGTAGSLNQSVLRDKDSPQPAMTNSAPINASEVMSQAASEGTEAQPEPLPVTGTWTSLLGSVGAGDWFVFPVRTNHLFTVVTQALDDVGAPTDMKAMPVIGAWDGYDATGVSAAAFSDAFNGNSLGETVLELSTDASEIIRISVADQRGDGRPDYAYRGWVLYADSVIPQVLPQSGGLIIINGMGFHSGDSVYVNGVRSSISEITPTQILALAPANSLGAIGSVDVEVNDIASYGASTTIPGGLSYGAASGDTLSLLTGPSGQVPLNTPVTFSVSAKQADGSPAGNVTVNFSITSGTAILACGQTICPVVTNAQGTAALSIAATTTSIATVKASLNNGSNVSVTFAGLSAPQLTALAPAIVVAAGGTVQWPVQALVLANNIPQSGQSVLWKSVTGITAPTSPSSTNTTGIASAVLNVTNLTANQSAVSQACLSGSSTCVQFTAMGSAPASATLSALSGASQEIEVGSSPVPVVIFVRDGSGNALAGATVSITQALYAWAPECPVHGRCDVPPLLSIERSNLVSASDGTISVTPIISSGNATTLQGVAAIGNAGLVQFVIDTHP